VTVEHWEAQLRGLIERHAAETGSARATEILRRWEGERGHFLQVCPKEMLPHLAHPLVREPEAMPAE
jgi:glutamate synthase (NADPH) large chain